MTWLLAVGVVVGKQAIDRGRDLIGQISRGDRKALRSLYDAFGPTVMAIALRILKARPSAEEIVQDTFVEIWKRAAQYDPSRGSVVAWVTTIARTRTLDRIRAEQRQSNARASIPHEPETAPAAPLELAEQRQERERVLAALSALPEDQRVAIELAYFEGLTQQEIADRLGQPLGTIKTRVRLAMDKLAGLLAESAEGRP